MRTLLLETKLYLPRAPRGLVPRLRLAERLDRGTASKLTLVSAPAGFGKTTVLAEWLTARPLAGQNEGAVAWLSLDRDDNHPQKFWTYVIAALRTVAPEVGASALVLLDAQQPPPIQTVLTTLVNDIDAAANEIVLVLDDYHLIEAPELQAGMVFLLDHLPQRLHLVIVARADPALPLSRLRARGELVELRAADLRFTDDEAAAYLNGVMGLQLTAHDMAALEGRTEGWIAALQLAALSLQGRDDVAGFIAGFAGDDRYVVDYLVEEVVQLQSPPVQTFLMQTSILSRLSGPLCDAVTGQGGGKAMLEALDRGNLFLVPLDDQRRWYRYHHLFADVLRARLMDEQSIQLPDLHRRASAWYEQHGEHSVAIGHALAAADFERAADLVERAIPAMRRDRQEAIARGWLALLPDELIRKRPVLAVSYAGSMLTSGELDGVEARLLDAERWLDPPAAIPAQHDAHPGGMVVVDEQAFRRLPALIAVYRAAMALVRGDVAATTTFAKRSLEVVEPDDDLGRGAAAGLLGLASWTSGDLEAGYRSYADCLASLRRAGHIADTLGCAVALADIRLAQGRPREAMRTYRQTLDLASSPAGPVLRGTADMYVGMSQIHREWDDLPAATQCLLTSSEFGEHIGLPQNPYRWRVAMARIREAEGDFDGALELLDDAERRYIGDFFPNVRPVAASKARVNLRLGNVDEALAWAREQGLSVDDQLSYLREYDHITLARTLLVQYHRDRSELPIHQAIGLLGRLLDAAEQGQRTGSVIEILMLLAVSHEVSGNLLAGLVPLERALILAEPEGYLRTFIDEGRSMAALLAAVSGVAPNYVRRLLTALGSGGALDNATASDKADGSRLAHRQVLIEPLSERELDVLRLLATELSGPQIARELVVSLNTVRTHTKSIYAKLAVNSRRAAVRRAEELDLLSRRNR
ncbi:MAG: ATP-dependent transcriptional regulator, MalT-like, LuxR family [Frankiales bacterium]|nr:ATP-dependent transcriptional regulator, MalT-like, LuxR family [Frankiales bacterium]